MTRTVFGLIIGVLATLGGLYYFGFVDEGLIGGSIASHEAAPTTSDNGCDESAENECDVLEARLNSLASNSDAVGAADLWSLCRYFNTSACKAACDQGDARACTQAGQHYETGLGVERDFETAAAYYRRGCDAGDFYGCTRLGELYAIGRGLVKDIDEAKKLFKKACENEIKLGCDNWALIDLDRATAQCAKNDAIACFALGLRYLRGEGVQLDRVEAKRLFKVACDGGLQIGCYAFNRF